MLKEKEGTIQEFADEGDKANQERYEDTNIRLIIAKYGIMPFEMRNQAQENLYLNNLGESMTLNEKLQMRQEVDEYFENLPANVRKNYNDSKEEFYQSIMTGDFEKLKADNVFSEEQVTEYSNQLNAQKNKMAQLEQQLQTERTKYEELQTKFNNQKNNNISDVQPTNPETI